MQKQRFSSLLHAAGQKCMALHQYPYEGRDIRDPLISIFSSSHLHILTTFTSSHLHIFSSAHPHIFSSSHLHIFTFSHLQIFSSSHLLIFTSYLLIFTSYLLTFTSHLHILTSSHLHIFSSSHLHILSCPLALFPSCSLLLSTREAPDSVSKNHINFQVPKTNPRPALAPGQSFPFCSRNEGAPVIPKPAIEALQKYWHKDKARLAGTRNFQILLLKFLKSWQLSKARSLHENKLSSIKLQHGHRWSHVNRQIIKTKKQNTPPKTARRRSPGQICVSPSQGQRSKQRKGQEPNKNNHNKKICQKTQWYKPTVSLHTQKHAAN